MSTPQERLAKLKATALPHVITGIAEDPAHKDRSHLAHEVMAKRQLEKALDEARNYHLEHPLGELADGATTDDMELHHLEETMMPLLRKNVPYFTAQKIVKEFVLPLKTEEKEPA